MKTIFKTLIPVCDAVATLFPGRLEVVLHDLATDTIAHIAGAFSNRAAGDPSLLTEEAAQIDGGGQDVIGPYGKRHWDGQRLKSVSAVIRDGDGRAVGLLCINLKAGEIEAAAELLRSLTGAFSDPAAQPLVAGDWREAAHSLIAETLAARGTTFAAADRADRVAVLRALDAGGILRIRGAADHVARILGISRASLYAALKQVRGAVTEAAVPETGDDDA